MSSKVRVIIILGKSLSNFRKDQIITFVVWCLIVNLSPHNEHREGLSDNSINHGQGLEAFHTCEYLSIYHSTMGVITENDRTKRFDWK